MPQIYRAILAIFCLILVAAPAVQAVEPATVTTFIPASNVAVNRSTLGELMQRDPEKDIFERDQLLGDIGGLRSALARYGMLLNIQETSEVFGNTTGGIKQSAAYDGLTAATLLLDTQQAFGHAGGLFEASALQVHGSNLSASNLGNLQLATSVEADNGVRLWELWYQQAFYYNKADIRIGEQSLDQEFLVSQNSNLFINSLFGWPLLPSVDMFAGGADYPLAAPGGRFRLQPGGPFTFLGGVFDDNPSGSCANPDPQVCNRRGTNFRVNDEPLFIGEVQYDASHSFTLPGIYKLGLWYDEGAFADPHYGTDGLSLANPASNDIPRRHRGNYSAYVVADQQIWQDSAQAARGVSLFFRGMGAPDDRNLVNMSINAGVTYSAPFAGRDSDMAGFGFGYARISDSASALDRDANAFSSTALPIRSDEFLAEAIYQYQLAPWWNLAPDAQYVMRPGGGISNPNHPGDRIGNELVVGLRTNITF